ncbi:hypothetical protein NPIL_231701 [Nephila pilipes]|uniref:Uncharacterized protein n=1 Tax=Nephila pilipes TaxID=299642 RepID=A0A8X6MWT5_NEPPI|nr:hypothetical protein NPIL_231701 [Nephila pilipes]
MGKPYLNLGFYICDKRSWHELRPQAVSHFQLDVQHHSGEPVSGCNFGRLNVRRLCRHVTLLNSIAQNFTEMTSRHHSLLVFDFEERELTGPFSVSKVGTEEALDSGEITSHSIFEFMCEYDL